MHPLVAGVGLGLIGAVWSVRSLEALLLVVAAREHERLAVRQPGPNPSKCETALKSPAYNIGIDSDCWNLVSWKSTIPCQLDIANKS